MQAETELIMQREQLIHADKLAALGTLTAGIAHEINNPNNAILLAAQVCEEAFSRLLPLFDATAREKGEMAIGGFSYVDLMVNFPDALSRITCNSRRIKQIVTDLKAFSGRDSGLTGEDITVNEVMESAIRLLKNLIMQSTDRFMVNYGHNIPLTKGSSQKLEQVFLNLLKNACYALKARERGIKVSTLYDSAKGWISIEVADEGTGMDEETLKKIFDPFFTTRRGQGGTGLGLSISGGDSK